MENFLLVGFEKEMDDVVCGLQLRYFIDLCAAGLSGFPGGQFRGNLGFVERDAVVAAGGSLVAALSGSVQIGLLAEAVSVVTVTLARIEASLRFSRWLESLVFVLLSFDVSGGESDEDENDGESHEKLVHCSG